MNYFQFTHLILKGRIASINTRILHLENVTQDERHRAKKNRRRKVAKWKETVRSCNSHFSCVIDQIQLQTLQQVKL